MFTKEDVLKDSPVLEAGKIIIHKDNKKYEVKINEEGFIYKEVLK